MATIKRRKLFVDPKVQGTLLFRAFIYWGFCLLALATMLLCWQVATGPTRLFYLHVDAMWRYFGPAVIGSMLLLPIVLVDIIRVSNRFAGPVYRLRRAMRQLAQGEEFQPIHFRDNDFWQDFANEFNALAQQHQQLREQAEGGSREHTKKSTEWAEPVGV